MILDNNSSSSRCFDEWEEELPPRIQVFGEDSFQSEESDSYSEDPTHHIAEDAEQNIVDDENTLEYFKQFRGIFLFVN